MSERERCSCVYFVISLVLCSVPIKDVSFKLINVFSEIWLPSQRNIIGF